jgi:hypothetical protein
METAIEIWNLLWEYQIHIVVAVVLVIWLLLRGSDVVRWLMRKLRGGSKPINGTGDSK